MAPCLCLTSKGGWCSMMWQIQVLLAASVGLGLGAHCAVGGCCPGVLSDCPPARLPTCWPLSPRLPAGAMLRFVQEMVLEEGWPLKEVLPLVTSNPASILRLPHKGRVAVGADADFLLLQVGPPCCVDTARWACPHI